MTVLGTRPEIVRLSLIIELLDRWSEHVLVHTGQNFVDPLDGIFFRELCVREPTLHLGVRGNGFGEQVGQILSRIEPAILRYRPERLLVLGDTNSGLCTLVARRLGVPVFHLEAGNRCFDDRVPEEVNRRAIDHASSVLLPYTENSRRHLLREGIAPERIYVVGNPIHQVMQMFSRQIDASDVLEKHALAERGYFLVTMHRAENVDRPERLRELIKMLDTLAYEFAKPVVCSVHPRTTSQMSAADSFPSSGGVKLLEPLGFFDFVRLERSAFCVISDSGTVQEEACLLHTPNVTIRDVTERPETVEHGSNIISGVNAGRVAECVRYVTSTSTEWNVPSEYTRSNVAETVVRIVLGHLVPTQAESDWLNGPPADPAGIPETGGARAYGLEQSATSASDGA